MDRGNPSMSLSTGSEDAMRTLMISMIILLIATSAYAGTWYEDFEDGRLELWARKGAKGEEPSNKGN